MFGVVGQACGPLIGMLLIHFYNWKSIFLINIPFCILTFIFIALFISEKHTKQQYKFDKFGYLLLLTIIINIFVLIALLEKQHHNFILITISLLVELLLIYIKIYHIKNYKNKFDNKF